MAAREDRIEGRIPAGLRRLVIEKAHRDGVTMNDVLAQALCALFGLDPKDWPVPRRPPGRRPALGKNGGKGKKG
jgi:hypothetical protein